MFKGSREGRRCASDGPKRPSQVSLVAALKLRGRLCQRLRKVGPKLPVAAGDGRAFAGRPGRKESVEVGLADADTPLTDAHGSQFAAVHHVPDRLLVQLQQLCDLPDR